MSILVLLIGDEKVHAASKLLAQCAVYCTLTQEVMVCILFVTYF